MLKVAQSRVCFIIFQIFTFHDWRKLYTLVAFSFFFALLYIVYSGDVLLWSAKKKKKPKSCMFLAVGSFVSLSFLYIKNHFLLDSHIWLIKIKMTQSQLFKTIWWPDSNFLSLKNQIKIFYIFQSLNIGAL